MKETVDGIDFLDMLREKSDRKGHTFNDLSDYFEMRAREQGVPIHGQFELTPLCNFDCKMCYTHLTAEQMKGRPLLTAPQWKEIIRQAWERGMFKATLTGGECLTYPGFEEIYLYLHSLGCEVHVLSNGLLLNESWVDFFKAHMPASIQITLYGNSDECYERVTGQRAFGKVCENIKRIQEAELPLRISITPNRFMGDSVFDTVRLAKSLCDSVEVNSGLFNPREETGRAGQEDDLGIDDYIKIYRLIEEIDGYEVREVPEEMLPEPGGTPTEDIPNGLRCGGGRSCFVVDWKGRMTPCNELEQIGADPLQEGFDKAWETINKACCNWPCVAECEVCPYVSVCRTCAAGMLKFAPPGVRPVKLCEQTRKMVRHGIYRIPGCG